MFQYDPEEDSVLKTLQFLKTVHIRACVIYTILITSVYFLGALVDSDWLPHPPAVLGLLLFSIYLGYSISFLSSDWLVGSLRVILHFLVTGILFWLLFARLGGYMAHGGAVGPVLAVYAAVYALTFGAVVLIRRLAVPGGAGTDKNGKTHPAAAQGKDSEYKSMFSESGGSERGK